MHACDYIAERLNLHNPLLTVNLALKELPTQQDGLHKKL
jgi:hypothetical protein